MFEQILIVSFLIFPVTWLIGYFIEILITRKAVFGHLGYFSPIVNALAYIGVFVHEACHKITCIIVRMPSRDFSVSLRNRYGNVDPHGHVVPEQPNQATLLQGVLAAFAPLLIGTWLVYLSLEAVFNPSIEPIYRIIACVFCISVLLAITPSKGDIRFAMGVFNNDPEYSVYQLFLVLLSFLALWWAVETFQLYFTLEYVYYFFLIAFYYGFKFAFLGIGFCFKEATKKRSKYRPKRFRHFARRRFRPRRIRHEEVRR